MTSSADIPSSGEGFSVGAIPLARVVIDGPEFTGVRYEDVVVQLFKQMAGPAGVSTNLHGHSTGLEGGELALEGGF
jgi:hypothetical protein